METWNKCSLAGASNRLSSTRHSEEHALKAFTTTRLDVKLVLDAFKALNLPLSAGNGLEVHFGWRCGKFGIDPLSR